MKIYYSPSKKGFYIDEMHGDLIPVDAVEIPEQLHQDLIAGESHGKVITVDSNGYPFLQDPPAQSDEQLLCTYEAAIEVRLDQFAQSRGYRHGDRLASYKGSPNATWAAEADRFIELRDLTWTKFISISDDVTSGKREVPTLDELFNELPALIWSK